MPRKDVFEKAPEFLAAFHNIVKNGFFEAIRVSVDGSEGNILSCHVDARGFLPNCPKYKAKGCSVLIDPQAIIAACRKDFNQRKTKSVSAKVETEKWWLYDREGEKVIGSRGERVLLSFTVLFR